MKALMAEEVLCASPDYNKLFKIYTDASNYQLGACIVQDDRPVAYYSRNLNSANATMQPSTKNFSMLLRH